MELVGNFFLFLFFDHLVSFILLSTPRLFQTQELSSFRIRKTILEHSVYSRPNKIIKVHQEIELKVYQDSVMKITQFIKSFHNRSKLKDLREDL